MVHIASIDGPADIVARLAELGVRPGVTMTRLNGLYKIGGITIALRLPPSVVIKYHTPPKM